VKAEEIIRQKLNGRTSCPKILPNDDIYLEEFEDRDDKGNLRGTIRHVITLEILANHLRAALEDSPTDGPNKIKEKREKIRQNNEVKDSSGKKIGVKIPEKLLDFWEKEEII